MINPKERQQALLSPNLEPYSKSRIQWEEPFCLGETQLTAEEVISLAAPQLTELRRQRLSQVVEHRFLSFAPVLENIHDQGNISAVMRSAEAFGFINFHLLETKRQRFKAARGVSKGTHKWLDVHIHSSARELVDDLHGRGFQVFATHLGEGSQALQELDFSRPMALVFGNEKTGVSEDLRALCDGQAVIPMYGFAQSFNISVAAALAFQWAHLQKSQAQGKAGDLTEEQKRLLLANYYLRSLDRPEEFLGQMARREGFEPSTLRSEV